MNRRGFLTIGLRAAFLGVALALPVSKLALRNGAGWEGQNYTRKLAAHFLKQFETSRLLTNNAAMQLPASFSDTITVRRPYPFAEVA
jgi:hypothetical protein